MYALSLAIRPSCRAEDNDGTAKMGEVRMVPDDNAHARGISSTCVLMVQRGELVRPWRRQDQEFQRKGKSSKMTLNEWETGRLGRTWARAVIHGFFLRLSLIDVRERTLETR